MGPLLKSSLLGINQPNVQNATFLSYIQAEIQKGSYYSLFLICVQWHFSVVSSLQTVNHKSPSAISWLQGYLLFKMPHKSVTEWRQGGFLSQRFHTQMKTKTTERSSGICWTTDGMRTTYFKAVVILCSFISFGSSYMSLV